jgi:hypothetical protein
MTGEGCPGYRTLNQRTTTLPEQIRTTLDRTLAELFTLRNIIATRPTSPGLQLLDGKKDATIR